MTRSSAETWPYAGNTVPQALSTFERKNTVLTVYGVSGKHKWACGAKIISEWGIHLRLALRAHSPIPSYTECSRTSFVYDGSGGNLEEKKAFLYRALVCHPWFVVGLIRCSKWFPVTLGVFSRSLKKIRMKKILLSRRFFPNKIFFLIEERAVMTRRELWY